MKTPAFLTTTSVTLWLLFALPAAQAQNFTNEWLITAHTGYTTIDATTKRTTNNNPWWGEHDDSNINYGLSVTYFPWGNLGVRAIYERGSNYRTSNQCPDDSTCTAIAITESGSMEHYAVTLAPEFDIYQNIFSFITLGASRTEVAAGPFLPSYRETDLIYGIGIGIRLDYGFFISAEYQTTNSDFETLRLSAGMRF
ncbi:outer membrane beta-barrel protein [Aliidiomarina sp.]|uniref:outer membrane beta-barrel protein n=1 Tax=Aliidiomarina sp. TaxID=1872439 RepID=UPI003A4D3416